MSLRARVILLLALLTLGALGVAVAVGVLGSSFRETPDEPDPPLDPAELEQLMDSVEASADLADLLSRGPLVPMIEETRWGYRARSGNATWNVAARKLGGDVRPRNGTEVRFHFIYGDVDGIEMVAKSIYAAPETGLEEFYLDAASFSLQHTPPVPLLPPNPRLGTRWSWEGHLGVEGDGAEHPVVRTQLEIRAVETLETEAGRFRTVRIDETTEGLRITRWFAPGTGMVRMVVKGTLHGQAVDFERTLTSFAGP